VGGVALQKGDKKRRMGYRGAKKKKEGDTKNFPKISPTARANGSYLFIFQ
jgi:hypothetical protein